MNQPVQTTLHAGKFLTLIKEGHWEYVDRVNASGASVIVAVTEEQKLLLVEQYRIPVHTRTIELLATRTHKARWPPELFEILPTCLIGREPLVKVQLVLWIIFGHSQKHYRLGVLSSIR